MKIASLTVKNLRMSNDIMSAISDIRLSDIVDSYTLSNTFYMKNQTSSSIELSDEFKNYKTYDDIVSSLSNDGYVVSDDLNNYLDKRIGGEVSGDMKILYGNYVQTTNNSQISVFSSKNAFLQAEAADGYGIAYAGSKGYCILSVDASSNRVQLSGDISLLQQIADGSKTTGNIAPYVLSNSLALKIPLGKGPSTARVGVDTNLSSAKFSIALSNKSSPSYYTIKSVNDSTGWVALNEDLSDYGIDEFDGKPPSFFTEDTWLSDDNAFYLAGFPEVGNANIKNFYSNHVEGGSTRAIGKYSHAEGRDTIASMRYSHAEGTCTVADEMAAHAEGFGTVASGRHAHSEGYLTLGSGKYAHVEGSYTQATAKAAHAEGEWTKAKGDCSHSEGYDTQANAAYSHVAGIHANVKSADLCAWCWSGISANVYYTSNGPGTFSINPNGGANGFYIGKTSLNSILANQTQPIIDKVDEISSAVQDEVYNTTVAVMQQELVDNKLTEYVLNMPETMVKTADLNRPLSFTAFKPGSTVAIIANGTPPERQFQWSFDMQTWNDYTIGEVITLENLLDHVYFKVSTLPAIAQSATNFYSFSLTGKIKAGGNIMSLLQPNVNQLASAQITITHAFIKLFIGQTVLETMPLLPATDLKNDCYNAMLSGCTNLTSVVDLPATNIPSRAYQWMFKGCTSIYNTPTMNIGYINPSESAQCFEMFSGCANLIKCNVTISTSNIASNCYGSMFNGCRRLENAPALPAQTLTTTNCYSTMFQNCSQINSISASFTEWNGDATKNWLNGVSSMGTFYHNASLSVDVVRSASTIPAGWELHVL